MVVEITDERQTGIAIQSYDTLEVSIIDLCKVAHTE